MNLHLSKRSGVLLLAGLVAVAGCDSKGSNGRDASSLGTLSGAVKNAAGAGLPGVTVSATPGDVPATATDSSGAYSLKLPAGSYTVAFAGDNLLPATATGVAVETGKTTTLDQTLKASPLVVTVNLPAALKNGGPSGFDTTVPVTATVQLDGVDAVNPEVSWTIKDYYGLSEPPTPATASPATGKSISFSIPGFELVRLGANAWMNERYGTAGTAGEFEYVPAPDRDQLLPFGTQQVRAMTYKVTAKATKNGLTSTGSALVSPVTIGSGANTLPLGMMVVGNARTAASYAWTLKYVATNASAGTGFGDPPAAVVLKGADTRNPTLVPTATGVYQLANGDSPPLTFRVSTYHGAGAKDTDAGADGVACAACHSGDHALSGKFDEWSRSAHGNSNWKDPFATPMSLFQLGLDGGAEGAHYSESCISCHTVGYSKVPSAQNSGFDDVMKATGWTFPTPPDTLDTTLANWNALPDALKHRGGIQCENCHGPLEPADHSAVAALDFDYELVPPVASMSAGICMVCHDALTHHDRGSLWSASGHAKMDLVLADATVEGRATTAAHCGRCHAAEGFMAYLPQQQGGNPGLIVRPSSLAAAATCTPGAGFTGATDPFDPACPCKPTAPATTCTGDPAFYAYLSGLGLNVATAHSQTCQTCHDPHSTELRVDGDTGTVAAGFNFRAAGAGALCMVCHNSRITAPIYSDSDKTSYSAPHAASQGDVFAGRNAYFFGPATGAAADALPNKAVHSFMADTCADCHVKWVPSDIKAKYQVWNTNHTFTSSKEVCSECHAAGIAEQTAAQVTEKMGSLATALSVLYKNKINAGGADAMPQFTVVDGAISDTLATTAAIAAGAVQRIALAEYHGQPALIVTLADGTVFGNNIGSFKKATVALFPVGTASEKIVAKSFFNWLLLRGSAEGVHNPAFVNGVLDATLTQMSAVSSL